jgi:hypothetical protein
LDEAADPSDAPLVEFEVDAVADDVSAEVEESLLPPPPDFA